MKEIAENDSRNREFPDGTYWIPTGKELCGRIACYRPGLVLSDFYRTSSVLVKDVSGSSRMNSEVAGKSERDRQMEEIPPVKVNPPNLSQQTVSGDTTSKDGNLKEVKAVRPSRAGSTPAAGPTKERSGEQ